MKTFRVKIFAFVEAGDSKEAEELAKTIAGDPKGFLIPRKDSTSAHVKTVVRPGSAIMVEE